MKRKLVAITLLAVLLMGGLAPSLAGRASAAAPAAPVAGMTHAHVALFDRTRFLLHMGAAFYAFHHWVYAPYKGGTLATSASGHTAARIKAGLALLFAYHEISVAVKIANGSNSGTLKMLVAPLNKLGSTASTLGAKLKGGDYNPVDVLNFNNLTNAFSKTASGAGNTIKDIAVKVPGL